MSTIKSTSTDRALAALNSLSPSEAEAEFLKCCGSREWARRVTAERPFADLDDLIAKSERFWWSLEPNEWLAAFHSHPKIGEQKAAAPTAAAAQQWSADEQSGIRYSAPQTIDDLAQLNREYDEKFGFIFIVCASGKSSQEMLSILRDRLGNDADDELRNAAAEQAKITQLRLRKLVGAK